jgi:excisionase family DNA binding protein
MRTIQPRAAALREALEQKQPHEKMTLLTVREALAMLRISRHLLYGYIQRNELPSVKLGKRRLFREADLLHFIERHREGMSA